MNPKTKMFTKKLQMLVLMNRKSTNSSSGFNLVFFMSPTNFPKMASWTQLLINGFIRPLSNIRLHMLDYNSSIFNLLKLSSDQAHWRSHYNDWLSYFILQVEVDAKKLMDSIVQVLLVFIDKLVQVMSMANYIHKWRFEVWETTFFQEIKQKGKIMWKKP